jgi:hypothetical protein
LAVLETRFDVLAAEFVAVFAVFVVVSAGVVEFKFVIGGTCTALFVLTPGWFVSTFASGTVTGTVSVASGLVERTETPPFSAGIESISAVSMKIVAVTIVVFDKTVAVPREPKALLEVLLVKSAPASDLPG